MRLHRNLVFTVIDSILLIFNEGEYADKVVAKALKKDKRWGSADRKFVAETIYEIVRWKRLYTEIAEVKEPFTRDDAWRIFTVWAVLRGYNLPDWKYFENAPIRRIKGRFDELSKIRKFKEAIPDWMDELGVKELGEELWSKEITAQNQQAQVILRVNTLKTTRKKLHAILMDLDIETIQPEEYPDALILKERANVFLTDAFKEGLFEVQDASSQLVAPFLGVEPGMRVVDTCAGAGGKTLHMASLMENKGQIIAMDIYESKQKQLKIRAKRNSAFNIEYRIIEGTKTIKKLHDKADRVLIDAPCSGLGVIKRNPDTKWKLQPEFIEEIKKVQQQILQDYSKIVKVGGNVVYATCSILPSENEKQIEQFLASEHGQNFKFIKDHKVLAHQTGFDGFYMALLERVK
ncbi:RsmB/NOP family class I SAM-dependent RNA methyltransferase [Myroides odoratus]|jgi:16S rRNA (cytosine967-C5)-methyltransferase|uniref:Ribosomal RNA small subunit methyltransferase B n=1 Tax=Myroides odoratus TaxID=256 RepID=A0A378RZC8_MYROD|nr:RsmB/NOP family class I SAM-dependent RNA methyltransferase [Myroides odoratus]EHQ41379.1 Fmu (Sun) domain protein [Myroides odoratus DSM 2801]EKB08750.1 ribosomal RNA small subunit methyltransferase B [Myroides odoratus CIP 103059]MCS4238956.1 16S rRNA (cytosine967-C5)-methyltransferase [Myroides odoratus]QQT98812.1 RsmB/NOP family class I SAM-dependent RNA methyltransferase [Myroides odoratus]QQU04525.1 RsmB/NOP family class I SAM-dependent RNA methyltransferase [Myroides odoratus]